MLSSTPGVSCPFRLSVSLAQACCPPGEDVKSLFYRRTRVKGYQTERVGTNRWKGVEHKRMVERGRCSLQAIGHRARVFYHNAGSRNKHPLNYRSRKMLPLIRSGGDFSSGSSNSGRDSRPILCRTLPLSGQYDGPSIDFGSRGRAESGKEAQRGKAFHRKSEEQQSIMLNPQYS